MAIETSLQGQVALVTGGGSGIGEAACEALAGASAAVAVVDLNLASAQTVAGRLEAAGCRALALEADVRSEDAVANAVAETVARLGGLNVVFANAGINGMQAPIQEMTREEWSTTIETNLTGTFLTVKHAIPHLRQAGGGSIVITSSINGSRLFSSPGYAAYSTSKAGQVAFAKMAAIELARWNIRVNAILPGSVRTNLGQRTFRRNLEEVAWKVAMPERWPPLTGDAADAADVGAIVLFLASDASHHITGAEIVIDGGQSLLQG